MVDELPKGNRSIPINELDLTYMTTEPAWGREAPEELRRLVSRIKESSYRDKDGNVVVYAESLWESLAMYTRDLRLGNISSMSGELEACTHWLNLAGDLLHDGLTNSFISAISRVISILELSQSKNGFLRRRQGTITQEKIGRDMAEPAKRNLIGGRKNE